MGTAAYHYRLIAILGKITLFNSRIKSIHIDMDDFSVTLANH
jgi:hypothetical protein